MLVDEAFGTSNDWYFTLHSGGAPAGGLAEFPLIGLGETTGAGVGVGVGVGAGVGDVGGVGAGGVAVGVGVGDGE